MDCYYEPQEIIGLRTTEHTMKKDSEPPVLHLDHFILYYRSL